jgi:hypothetical protein
MMVQDDDYYVVKSIKEKRKKDYRRDAEGAEEERRRARMAGRSKRDSSLRGPARLKSGAEEKPGHCARNAVVGGRLARGGADFGVVRSEEEK